MTKERALKLLNLNEPFTEDDLNKAFRSLTNKWHPDKFASDTPEYIQAQEKMTELNIARDTLKKILKERDKNYNAYQTGINKKNIDAYKSLLADKLAKYISDKSMSTSLKKYYDDADRNVFNSLSNVKLDKVITYFEDDIKHNFLDKY